MEFYCILFPVAFVAGSLQLHQATTSENLISSHRKSEEVVSNYTHVLASSLGNEEHLTEKHFEECNTTKKQCVSSPNYHVMNDGEIFGTNIVSSLRLKRESISESTSSLTNVGDILDLLLFPLILTVGLILNITLLYIYLAHKELLTQRNALIINLAVSDSLFVLVFGIFRVFSSIKHLEPGDYQEPLCKLFVFCVCAWSSMSAYSITLISAQRYLRVAKFNTPVMKKAMTIFGRPVGLVSTVWMVSIVLAIPELARRRVVGNEFRCRDPKVFVHGSYPFIAFGILPGTIAAVFYWAVQKRPLQQRLAGDLLRKDRPGRVLLYLGVVYVLTYAPLLVCDLIIDNEPKPSEETDWMDIFYYTSRVLHLLNPVFCPIALCFASGRLRRYFRKCLLCKCTAREDTAVSPRSIFYVHVDPANSVMHVEEPLRQVLSK